jgi:hypothetical protein
MKTLVKSLLIALVCAHPLRAEEAELKLAVPQVLEDAGFMQFLVPRFSLKTSIRITRVAEGDDAQMRLGSDGTPVFTGPDAAYALQHDGDPRAERFLDWLTSDVGQRTIESFEAPDGTIFGLPAAIKATKAETAIKGDAVLGETLSLNKCGRCHVVSEKNRMKGMGSTPSFALLRTFEDWQTRFATFHELKPHPSFTQLSGVSEAFDPSRPPPIVPLTMTLDDLEAILAYVAGIKPADLGAPLQVQ